MKLILSGAFISAIILGQFYLADDETQGNLPLREASISPQVDKPVVEATSGERSYDESAIADIEKEFIAESSEQSASEDRSRANISPEEVRTDLDFNLRETIGPNYDRDLTTIDCDNEVCTVEMKYTKDKNTSTFNMPIYESLQHLGKIKISWDDQDGLYKIEIARR